MKLKFKAFTIVGLLICGIFFLVPKTQAAVTIEQQINIINQEYFTTASGSAEPTNNQLGIIYWEGSKYSGETVYFEADIKCDSCSGGNAQVTAQLYTKSGTPVTNAVVSTQSSTYALIRSTQPITSNIINQTEYSVRIMLDADNGTAYINQAKLIIVQSGESITDTQTQIEMGNYVAMNTTDFAVMSAPKIFHYDSYFYNPQPTVRFEATLKSNHAEQIAYAMLSSSSDCGTGVSSSIVTTSGVQWNRVRSGTIELATSTSYFICLKTSDPAHPVSISNAKIILDQSDTNGIDSLMFNHQLVNSYTEISSDTFTTVPIKSSFNPVNFSGKYFDYYFETTIKTSNNTGYAQLYNNNAGTIISPSEVSTISNAYSRKRSETLAMPTSTSDLVTQIRNSNAQSTSLSSSTLVIYMFTEPKMMFSIDGVPKNTITNGITTTSASNPARLEFGSLIPQEPEFLAHKLTVSTNNAQGYLVNVKMLHPLQGNYPANFINDFPTTWDNPISWYEPPTDSPVTGWFGANTSDARVPNWSNAAGLFGPVGSTNQAVMRSTGNDPGTSIYVTYAVEVNNQHPTDLYAGTIVYSLIPAY